MGWTHLLFSVRGRINRAKYWLATLIMLIAFIAFLTLPVLVLPPALWLLIGGPAVVLSIYVGIAVAAKRLHDRDKSAWWLLFFYGVPALLDGLARASGEGSGADLLLSLGSLAVTIWALVELGILRGTVGPNRYGDDPLAGSPAAVVAGTP